MPSSRFMISLSIGVVSAIKGLVVGIFCIGRPFLWSGLVTGGLGWTTGPLRERVAQ
jgi:hypothetical protein